MKTFLKYENGNMKRNIIYENNEKSKNNYKSNIY